MVRKIDLTGKRFGLLTVLREKPERRNGQILWECHCECGKPVIRSGKSMSKTIRQGGLPSCGCYQAEISRARHFKNLLGKRFGRLTVVAYAGSHPKEKVSMWECLCDCGQTTVVRGFFLLREHTTSCGCRKREINRTAGNKTRTHGMSGRREYHIRDSMIARCHNPNNVSYPDYGGRGIYVCDRWLESFENFYEDMGACPPDKNSIDRINNDGPYSPGNCRWSEPIEQSRNRRNTIWLEFQGQKKTLAEWSEVTGIKTSTLMYRHHKGWTPEEIITTPTIKPKTLTFNGETKTLMEWSEVTGIDYGTLWYRSSKGLSPAGILAPVA